MGAIGWIGLGVMGAPMAGRIVAAGYALEVCVGSETASVRAAELGARVHRSPRHVAEEADIVVTVLPGPPEVRSTYEGTNGLLAGARPGLHFIDMSTSSPDLARQLANRARAIGAFAVDAPVSGGPAGAREGTLSIMVGAEPAAIAEVRPILDVLGSTIVAHGGPGSGQAAKLANQVALAGAMLGICEAYLFAREQGLDPRLMLDSLAGGIAGSRLTAFIWERLASAEMASGFKVALMVKDLRLVQDSARDLRLHLPGVDLALQLYECAIAAGFVDGASQVLVAGIDDPARWLTT